MKIISQQAIDELDATYQEIFATAPARHFQAPGRVNLIGEHTDYNDGFVLPCAINYQTLVAVTPREDDLVRVVAADYDNERDEFSLNSPIAPHPTQLWSNYIRGVIKHLQLRGMQLKGVDMVVSGNVPQGAGLSSSASLEVVIGETFRQLFDLPLTSADIALNGQEAENQFVGCNCGIMDQMVSACGAQNNALLLDCRSLESQLISMPPELDVVIINSNVKRGLVDSEYNTRREQCEEAAEHGGVRMTGGGFGGCIVALMPREMVAGAQQLIAERYQPETGYQETFYVCCASDGAGEVRF